MIWRHFAPPRGTFPQGVESGQNPKAKRSLSLKRLRWIKAVALAALFLALVCSLLYSQAKVTELGAAIDSQSSVLDDLNSDYDYLTSQMEMKTNMKSVQGVCHEPAGSGGTGSLSDYVCRRR